VDGQDRGLAVVEPNGLASAADVGRVDLELRVEDVGVAGSDVAELERELAVPTGLPDRARLDRVDLHALRPARIEDESGVLQVLVRSDVEAPLPEKAAADGRRGEDRERRRSRDRARSVRTLAEDVQ